MSNKKEIKIGQRVRIDPPHKDWQDRELLLLVGKNYGGMSNPDSGKWKVHNVNKKQTELFFESRVKPYNR